MSQNAEGKKESGSIASQAPSLYVTIKAEGTAEYEEKRSRFIGYVKPVKSEEAALEFIGSIKKRHYDARHNVWAYHIDGGRVARYSDDGEPQGSAGIPVLECIKKSGITDTAVVVTRYFGGVLLGVGGLVRSYTKAASAAIEAAGIASFELFSEFTLKCSYSDYQRVGFELGLADTIIDGVDYTEDVTLRFAVRKNAARTLNARLADILEGRGAPQFTGERYDSL